MRLFLPLSAVLLVLSWGALFLLSKENRFEIVLSTADQAIISPAKTEKIPERVKENSSDFFADFPPQKPLAHPPQSIKAIYSTNWSAADPAKIDYFIDLIDQTELNSLVIDIKDYSGYLPYHTNLEEVVKYQAEKVKITKINALIKKLHDKNIYVIGRIAVFQDQALAKARPDLALKNSATGKIWMDKKGLSWLDPASKEVWDYNLKISKDALERGFDEINFDYIRFPSDGDLKNITYPYYNQTKTKQEVIKEFFAYLRTNLPEAKISADLFGLATVNNDDLGIGQIIEDAYQYFDYVAPMVYPSHYASGFLGYQNPANYPYEVVKYSLENAKRKLTTSGITTVKLRPWLQDFNLGANYDREKVVAQIKALKDLGLNDGWMLWNPSNVYTKEALDKE